MMDELVNVPSSKWTTRTARWVKFHKVPIIWDGKQKREGLGG
jgi:hypothetical protein